MAVSILGSILDRVLGRRAEPIGGYRAFTRRFDVVCNASELDQVFEPLSTSGNASWNEAWTAFNEALAGWKVRVAIAALASAERVQAAVPPEQRRATVVSLLIDLSGSMRGEKVLLASAAADCANDYLGGLEAKTEILGFTTRAWRGGRARAAWRLRGSPSAPGRLNELLHVIFVEASDTRRSTGGWSMRQMLRPELHKENIDGEALEWAAARLRNRPETRKILIVLSDGAPVDDATLMANGPTYLSDHLKAVLADIEAAGDIEVAALGIGHDVNLLYQRWARTDVPGDIGEHLLALLEEVLVSPIEGLSAAG